MNAKEITKKMGHALKRRIDMESPGLEKESARGRKEEEVSGGGKCQGGSWCKRRRFTGGSKLKEASRRGKEVRN